MDDPEAWRIRERVLRKWVRRNGLVWVDVSPLRKEEMLVADEDVGGEEAGLLGLKVNTPAAC